MFGWAYYGTSSLQICPYMPGCPVYRDGVLPQLYLWAKAEGKVEAAFCGDTLTMDDFVAYFQKRKTLQILCQVSQEKDLKPCGFSWIDLPKGTDGARSAMIGFCFFRWGIRSALDLARLGLAYCFEDLRIDTLHGVQVASNVAAERFALKMGFQSCSLIPDYHCHGGKMEAARVVYLRKADFWPGFEQWRASQKMAQPERNPVEI